MSLFNFLKKTPRKQPRIISKKKAIPEPPQQVRTPPHFWRKPQKRTIQAWVSIYDIKKRKEITKRIYCPLVEEIDANKVLLIPKHGRLKFKNRNKKIINVRLHWFDRKTKGDLICWLESSTGPWPLLPGDSINW